MDEQQSIMNNFLDILTDGVHSLKQENNKGYESQHSVTGKGRFDNLLQHLSDPWHNTIVQTLSGGN
ncbi:putative chlorophyll A-B binding protein, plant [Medicago truncatula]|uniref:Putative chlorophyll A-B binding protein, plant n=1 Tax=Medicago truncatula TaxID=3880 RepID=A0A396HNH1_MEDTR|nr:putative chlorophyll A-B binding protein, plant [Medicago truncatula]